MASTRDTGRASRTSFRWERPVLLAGFAALYVATLHRHGYAGDPNQYLDLARSGRWEERPEHFGYYALVGAAVRSLGWLSVSPYVAQGLVSIIAALVALAVFETLCEGRGRGAPGALTAPRSALLEVALLGLSGQFFALAAYGETYMLQIAAMLVAAWLLRERRVTAAVAILVLSISLSPLSLPLMGFPLAFYAVRAGGRTQVRADIPRALVTAIVTLAALTAIVAVTKPGFPHAWMATYVKGGAGWHATPWTLSHLKNHAMWFVRGFNGLVPFIVIGMLAAVRGRRDVFFWGWATTMLLSAYFLFKVPDLWTMLGLLSASYAVWGAAGLRTASSRLRLHGSGARAAAVLVVGTMGAISAADIVARDHIVAREVRAVALEIPSRLDGALILTYWGLEEAIDHYGDGTHQAETPGLAPVLHAYLESAGPPPSAHVAEAIDRRLLAGEPVFVVLRKQKYTTPAMEVILRGRRPESGEADAYRRLLPRYSLEKAIDLGEYHEAWKLSPGTATVGAAR